MFNSTHLIGGGFSPSLHIICISKLTFSNNNSNLILHIKLLTTFRKRDMNSFGFYTKTLKTVNYFGVYLKQSS